MSQKRSTVVILISATTVAVALGAKQSFGLFLSPITEFLKTGRETFSFAIALQNIVCGLPLAGILADRIGPRWVVCSGALLYAGGFILLSISTTSWLTFLSMGFLVGLALSATSYVVLLGAVARVVPEEKRASSFGIVTAAGSFGTFTVVPLVQWLMNTVSWQLTLIYGSIIVGSLAVFAIGYPGRSESLDRTNRPEPDNDLFATLKLAFSHNGYLLLNVGFFVCGFHVAFIATHLPAFLTDRGLQNMTAATALSLIGLFNMGGSYLFGYLGDRYRKKYLLSMLYLLRAIVISGFVIFPVSKTTTLIFACVIGFLWLATVPLTSGIVAQMFGPRHLSSLYGFVFFSHQIGAFIGIWMGGHIFDVTGSYNSVWLGAIVLGIAASIVHLPINDRFCGKL